ncbi:deoxynucleoside kinase [Ghiorsea bivora]|uniref:deoxynucleoside kinase n=1 Tax=Ghiorsea bivora TaxID=1485545 RepID=UPI000570C649|nr:deoxynucleoside kinase [Ghiorsea bivora]
MATSALNLNHIAIEGGIGVGKTTLAQGLANKLNASLLLEDIDDNPFLELFYQDPERHGLSVQLSFLFSRLKQWQSLAQQNLFQSMMISDYIFAKDRLFAMTNLSDEEFTLYNQVAQAVTIDLPKPDLVVYLQSSPEVALKRIQQRNRNMEKGVNLDYLKQVTETFDKFFFHYQETPLLVVQTDRINFSEHPEALDMLIARIQHMGRGTEFWADYTD